MRLSVLALLSPCVSPARASECRTEPGGAATVVRIVDSETVALDDGREVRLAGVLGPRAEDVGAAPGTWKPEIEARATLEAAALGRRVTLGFGSLRKDRHGRNVAHVYVGQKGPDTWLQRILVEAGTARAYGFGADPRCAADLAAYEDGARKTRSGLWQEGAYAVRTPPVGRQAWRHLDGTFQIVEIEAGRIWSNRDDYRILPASRSAGQLSVTVKRTDRDLLGALGGDPRSLRGRHLQARGWIVSRRDRPGSWEIDTSSAGGLRLVEKRDSDRAHERAARPPSARER
jgi:endonuclease YncB( thermonuclease family)